MNDSPQIKQTGIALLQENALGLQILDAAGNEIYAYQKSDNAQDCYSNIDLLLLDRTGHLDNENAISEDRTCFVGSIAEKEKDYAYILYFPMKIQKVTMYFNGRRTCWAIHQQIKKNQGIPRFSKSKFFKNLSACDFLLIGQFFSAIIGKDYQIMTKIDILTEGIVLDRNVNIITDLKGNKIVLINDIIFKGKRSVNWDDVKNYLETYVGEFYEIADTT